MTAHDIPRRIEAPAGYGPGCPNCGRALVRRDTGLCDPCTAKTPEARGEWQEWRGVGSEKAVRFSEPLPADCCMRCLTPLGGRTQGTHDKFCLGKPFSCSCGRTYSNPHDLKVHRRARGHP